MNLFRLFLCFFKGKKAGYSVKGLWGRTIHYNKYGEKIGYTVKSFFGKRKRYDINGNLISYSVRNFWGGYNTYDADGNLISKSYKNILGGYTTYDKNGVKRRISYKGFWDIMQHFDLEEPDTYDSFSVGKSTSYSKSTSTGKLFQNNSMISDVNIRNLLKEKEEVEVSNQKESLQDGSFVKSSGYMNNLDTMKEKKQKILEETPNVIIENYMKYVSEGQHIDKTVEYYQSVAECVETMQITKYAKLLVFQHKTLEEFPAIAYLCGDMIKVVPMLCKAKTFEISPLEINTVKKVHVTGIDMNAMDNEFLTCSMSSLGKEFEELLPEYPFGNDGIYRVQYVFECGLIITEKSMKELQVLLNRSF